MEITRGMAEALEGFAEGVLPDRVLFQSALASAYSKLDQTKDQHPSADLQLGYEFLELIEAMFFRTGVESETSSKQLGTRATVDKRRHQSLADQSDQAVLQRLLSLKFTTPKARILSMALLGEFGDMNNVLNATEPRIKMIYGADDELIEVLHLVRTIKSRALMDETCRQKPIRDASQVFDYAVASMAHLDIVTVKVMYLDRIRELIGIETLQTGDCELVAIYPRELAARALDLSARYVIILHNQPDGIQDPQYGFMENIKHLEDAIGNLGIHLIDYVLVARPLCFSLKRLNVLNPGQETPLLFQPELE